MRIMCGNTEGRLCDKMAIQFEKKLCSGVTKCVIILTL